MQHLLPVKMDLLYLGREIVFVEMNKLALEPNEILKISSYIIGTVELPAIQGFMVPMNCLRGN